MGYLLSASVIIYARGNWPKNSSVYQSMRKPVETGARGSKVAMQPFFGTGARTVWQDYPRANGHFSPSSLFYAPRRWWTQLLPFSRKFVKACCLPAKLENWTTLRPGWADDFGTPRTEKMLDILRQQVFPKDRSLWTVWNSNVAMNRMRYILGGITDALGTTQKQPKE